MYRENIKLRKTDYLLIGIIVALTGFEYAYRASIYIQASIMISTLIYFIYRGKRVNNKFFLILLIFLIPLFFQIFVFNSLYFGFANILMYTVQFTLCYLVLELTKDNFNFVFVNFIYFIAVISLIFFPTQFFLPLQETIKNSIGSLVQPLGTENIPEGFKSHTLIFFTYQHSYGQGIEGIELRNCGPFWEPGMFGVFLCIALLINIHINQTRILTKKNIVFIISLLTTLSTASYFVLFLILISKYFLLNRTKSILYLPILVIFILISYTYIWSLDFMKDKVETNLITSTFDRKSRFGSIIYHFNELSESPLTGVVLSKAETEKDIDFLDKEVSPNGLSYIFFAFGIPAAITYLVIFFRGVYRWLDYKHIRNKRVKLFFILLLLLLAFSQDITIRPFYIMLLFLGICLPKGSKDLAT